LIEQCHEEYNRLVLQHVEEYSRPRDGPETVTLKSTREATEYQDPQRIVGAFGATVTGSASQASKTVQGREDSGFSMSGLIGLGEI
ncbi:MAG: hypothetical protein SGCHY_003324, partial [Lobulomycetales sp.]